MNFPAIRHLANAIHFIASVLLIPAIAVIIASDVFCRYVLGAPIFWAQEITTLLLLLVFFGAQPLCLRDDVHIRMELLYSRFGDVAKRMIDSLSLAIVIFIAGLITYRLSRELTDPFSRTDTHGFLKVSLIPFRVIVVVIMIVVILESVMKIVRTVRRAP